MNLSIVLLRSRRPMMTSSMPQIIFRSQNMDFQPSNWREKSYVSGENLVIGPNQFRNRSETDSKPIWDWFDIDPKLVQNCSETDPKMTRNWSEIDPKLVWNWLETCLKLAWN